MSDMEKLLSSLSEEQRVALTKLLQADLGGAAEELPTEPAGPQPSVGEDFIIRNRKLDKTKRRSTVKAGKNQWKDDGEFKNIETHLPEDFEKTPRRKAPPKKQEVECHLCGKSFKQDARYAYGNFPRCNKCIGR
jgi:hypothetical protein